MSRLAKEYHNEDFKFEDMESILELKIPKYEIVNEDARRMHNIMASKSWEEYHLKNHNGYKEGGSYKLRKYLLHAYPRLSKAIESVNFNELVTKLVDLIVSN